MSKVVSKAFLICAAAGAVLAAAGVFVVALAYAGFALARESLSPAGAAASVAGAVALILVVVALVLVAKSNLKKKPEPEPTLGEKAAELIKRKPIMAAALALGGGFLALRNPALVTTLVMSFLAPAPPRKR